MGVLVTRFFLDALGGETVKTLTSCLFPHLSQTPNDISDDVVGLNVGRSDPVEAATETLHDVGSSARQRLLSRVGLRAGISAPPELAQAVLEGVFWCRWVVFG